MLEEEGLRIGQEQGHQRAEEGGAGLFLAGNVNSWFLP
jgi:hypothetical protein